MTRGRFRIGRSTMIGVAAVSIAASGLLVTAASASSATGSTRAVPLDHFLCYGAQAPNFAIPTKVVLKNFLNPTGFSPPFSSVAAHCNPTVKQVTTTAGKKTYGVVHAYAHLLCWKIYWQNKPQTVVLSNQFGKAQMVAGSPTKLCVPSWKSKTGPPNKSIVAPPNLDHFTCYPLTRSTTSYGFSAPGPLMVKDEFSAPRFVGVKIGIANQLCVPTTKIYQGRAYSPISAADLSLVCFPVNKTPYWKIAYDENQFGQAAVFPTAPPEELCLPSTAAL